jgi:putative oxidoreductase
MKLGLAVLRMLVGGLFIGHGLQKLAGWFGGHGLGATAKFFESLGLRPGKAHATASGVAETAGGALLAAGFLTPLGASLISGSMITAIRKVHAKNGVWVSNGGFEYNAVLLGTVFAITDVGPGSWSLDAARGRRLAGPGWALAELAAGAAGSAAAIAVGERFGRDDGVAATAAGQAGQAGAEQRGNGHVAPVSAGA